MNPLLLTVWAVLTLCFLALLVYRGQLTRYEDEQLFLNDSIHHNEREMQTTIVRKIHKIQPVVHLVGGAAALVTVCAVGIYVWNAWKQIQ
jgi:cytochrome c-type biogenesis protein CcmH/NrfG